MTTTVEEVGDDYTAEDVDLHDSKLTTINPPPQASHEHMDHLDAVEIVKARLGFDEIAFREELKREQERINQQIKGTRELAPHMNRAI